MSALIAPIDTFAPLTNETEPPIAPWPAETAQLWGRRPLALAHTLHNAPLFSRAALIDLIETYPRSHYALVHMGGEQDRRHWQEGDIGGLGGAQVFEAIARGRMWLNLRDVSSLDRRYKDLLDAIFATFEQRLPGFSAPQRGCGILISSPGAQVYYHADLPGQMLWQIEGKKRVLLYPNAPPFLSTRNLEDIALFDMELDVPYEPWFDRHADVFTLEPGTFLTWPLNAPHRVQNLDVLNVSMTISYTNEEIRRLQILNLANGMLRHRFGRSQPARKISGPSYWAKAALQKAFRGSPWVRQARAKRRQITFKLDSEHPGAILPIAPDRPA